MSSRRLTAQCLRASTKKDSTTGGSAAVRDFDPAYVRFGSNSTDAAEATRPFMSAVRPIATVNSMRQHVSHCARSRHCAASIDHLVGELLE